jgi:hypothetical protein
MARNVPTPPANQYTPNFNVVDTVAGFNQGDMVYFNNGDFGRLANNAVTSANFNVTNSVPYFANNSSIGGGTTTILAASPYTGTFGGTVSGYSAAKLTNGNIVRVGGNTSNYPYFVITDTANNVVVASTVISTTYTMNNNGGVVSVAALSGGGFAVAYTNSTTSTIYAVYTNAGAVTLAVTSDTTLLPYQGALPATILALPNGGFVVAQMSSTAVLFRIFNAAGTALYITTTYTTPTGPNYTYGQIQMAARSDSSFVLHIASQDKFNAYYAVYSATNTQLTTGSTMPTNATACCIGVSASVLADGTTFVLGYQNFASPTYYAAFKLLPTGNVLGSEVAMPAQTFTTPTIGFNTFALGLTSGNFIFGQVDARGYITYVFYSSAGVAISGTSSSSVFLRTAATTGFNANMVRQYVCPLEYSGNVNLFWSEGSGFATSQSAACLVALSQTTYDPIPLGLSASLLVGTLSQSVNGINQSTQTPVTGNFYAANTATSFLASSAAATTVISRTIVSTDTFDSFALITLNNGNFVYVYRSSTTFTVSASVYSPTGVLITTFAVGTSSSVVMVDSVRAAALSSGKFVIAYANGTGSNQNVTSVVYSATYTLLTTITTTGLSFTYGATLGTWTGSTVIFDIAPITNDRFVLHAILTSTTYPNYFVYSSSGGAALSTAQLFAIAGYTNQSVIGLPQGGFVAFCRIGGVGTRVTPVTNVSGNTFVVLSNFTAGTAGNLYDVNPVAFPNGSYATYSYTGANQIDFIFWASGAGNNNSSQPNGNIFNSNGASATFGSTAYGEAVAVYANTTSATTIAYTVMPANASQNINTVANVTLSDVTSFLSGGPLRISNLYGRYMVLAYINSSNQPVFIAFNAVPFLGTLTTTAGVTQSNSTAITTPMAGIAATTTTANTSGVLQTNGACQVNSSYSASTPYTAFSVGATAGGNGVKGTILGRNVQLVGNL